MCGVSVIFFRLVSLSVRQSGLGYFVFCFFFESELESRESGFELKDFRISNLQFNQSQSFDFVESYIFKQIETTQL